MPELKIEREIQATLDGRSIIQKVAYKTIGSLIPDVKFLG